LLPAFYLPAIGHAFDFAAWRTLLASGFFTT
jgi:hypothetical protein